MIFMCKYLQTKGTVNEIKKIILSLTMEQLVFKIAIDYIAHH